MAIETIVVFAILVYTISLAVVAFRGRNTNGLDKFRAIVEYERLERSRISDERDLAKEICAQVEAQLREAQKLNDQLSWQNEELLAEVEKLQRLLGGQGESLTR